MEIASILSAGTFLSAALGQLAKRTEPAAPVEDKRLDASASQAGRGPDHATALRQILERYDVAEITPREFSKMIQELYEAGVLSEQGVQELSGIRVDLDLEGADPDEPLDLVSLYADKLQEIEDELSGSETPIGSSKALTPSMARTRQRLAWLEKLALIHSGADEFGLDELA